MRFVNGFLSAAVSKGTYPTGPDGRQRWLKIAIEFSLRLNVHTAS